MGLAGRLDAFGISDRGRARPHNEDQFLIADLQKSMLISQASLSREEQTRLFGRSQGQLLVVADGMGGLGGGERASRIAVEGIVRYALNTMDWFFRLAQERPDDLRDELVAGLQASQRDIEKELDRNPLMPAMGTTLTMAYVLWPRLYVVHAGDSRAYLCRGGELEQVTTDHTIARQLVERGVMRPTEARRWSNMLYNFVGSTEGKLTPDVYRAELKPGDALVLCTDGLTRHVQDASIAELLSLNIPADQTCRQLVELANAGGGRDNITVIVGRTDMTPQPTSVFPALPRPGSP